MAEIPGLLEDKKENPTHPKGTLPAKSKYTEQFKEQVILEVLKNSMKVSMIPVGERFIKPGDVSTSIVVILKGNALVRIPYDNIKTRMTIRRYFQYLIDDHTEQDPLAVVLRPNFKTPNQDIMFDYNEGLKEIIEIKEVYRKKEAQRIQEEKNRLMNDLYAQKTLRLAPSGA